MLHTLNDNGLSAAGNLQYSLEAQDTIASGYQQPLEPALNRPKESARSRPTKRYRTDSHVESRVRKSCRCASGRIAWKVKSGVRMQVAEQAVCGGPSRPDSEIGATGFIERRQPTVGPRRLSTRSSFEMTRRFAIATWLAHSV